MGIFIAHVFEDHHLQPEQLTVRRTLTFFWQSKRMKLPRGYTFGALIVAASAAVYLFTKAWPPPDLVFRDRVFPAGFRDLLLEGASSQPDPLLGLQQLPSKKAIPKLDDREICEELFNDPSSPAVGHSLRRPQIVTFLDYQCPYCKKLTEIISKLPSDDIRIVYKEWPVLGENSVIAARAALAADKQGKYIPFHTRLMGNRLILTPVYAEEIAKELGINPLQLRYDMNSTSTTSAIERTSALASALGFVGTPVIVVGHTIVQGDIKKDQLQRLIEIEKKLKIGNDCQ
jgi:protein-disulfide isomerase